MSAARGQIALSILRTQDRQSAENSVIPIARKDCSIEKDDVFSPPAQIPGKIRMAIGRRQEKQTYSHL
jgi:hypothetical protein